MRIAIVGGHGKVARQLHPLLARAGHTPVALGVTTLTGRSSKH